MKRLGSRWCVKKKRSWLAIAKARADAKAIAKAKVAEYDARVIARLEKARAAIALADADAKAKRWRNILKRSNWVTDKESFGGAAAVDNHPNTESPLARMIREDGPNFTAAYNLYKRFSIAVLGHADYHTARDILPQLKEKLAGFTSLPPFSGESTPCSVNEQVLARFVYEVAVFLSVVIEDQDAFARDFSVLRPFYTESRYRHQSSDMEYDILHLNLLRLLLLNGLADFHTELESLSAAAEENPYCIKKPYQMGPRKYKCVFVKSRVVNFLLSPTDRDKISGWTMKAADGSSSMSDGQKMLLSLSEQKLVEYIEEYHPEWEMKDGSVVPKRAEDEEEMSKHCTTMMKLINQALCFIVDLEDPKALSQLKVI